MKWILLFVAVLAAAWSFARWEHQHSTTATCYFERVVDSQGQAMHFEVSLADILGDRDYVLAHHGLERTMMFPRAKLSWCEGHIDSSGYYNNRRIHP